MTRETMIAVARAQATASNEPVSEYWGEPKSVMLIISACAGFKFHVGGKGVGI